MLAEAATLGLDLADLADLVAAAEPASPRVPTVAAFREAISPTFTLRTERNLALSSSIDPATLADSTEHCGTPFSPPLLIVPTFPVGWCGIAPGGATSLLEG